MLDLTIAAEILAFKEPHIYEYFHFCLYLSSVVNIFCEAKASAPGIPSADWTIRVKFCLRSRQSWSYKSFFSFSAFARAFSGVMHR